MIVLIEHNIKDKLPPSTNDVYLVDVMHTGVDTLTGKSINSGLFKVRTWYERKIVENKDVINVIENLKPLGSL